MQPDENLLTTFMRGMGQYLASRQFHMRGGNPDYTGGVRQTLDNRGVSERLQDAMDLELSDDYTYRTPERRRDYGSFSTPDTGIFAPINPSPGVDLIPSRLNGTPLINLGNVLQEIPEEYEVLDTRSPAWK